MLDKKKKFVVFFIFASLIALGILYSLSEIQNETDCKDCNIILISITTLRSDHLGTYGYPRNTTPNIDKFAEKSTLFEDVYSTSSWTLPSQMSIFTSVVPSYHKLYNVSQDSTLSNEIYTLPELLKEKDYKNIWVAPLWLEFLNLERGFERGFDEFYSSYSNSSQSYEKSYEKEENYWKNAFYLIDNYNNSEKFFMFLHSYKLHSPYSPQPETIELFDKNLTKESNYLAGKFGFLDMNKENMEYFKTLYDAELYEMDKKFGMFIDKLQEKGILDNTIIILTGDHGQEFYEHKRIGHGITLYDEVIKVPLIIYVPKGQKRRVKIRVSSLDILPTTLDLIGLESPKYIQGTSLKEMMLGGENHIENKNKVIISELYGEKIALIEDNWKYIADIERVSSKCFIIDDKSELFDLENDSEEKNNLFFEREEVVKRLKSKLIDKMNNPNKPLSGSCDFKERI